MSLEPTNSSYNLKLTQYIYLVFSITILPILQHTLRIWEIFQGIYKMQLRHFQS